MSEEVHKHYPTCVIIGFIKLYWRGLRGIIDGAPNPRGILHDGVADNFVPVNAQLDIITQRGVQRVNTVALLKNVVQRLRE